MTRRLLIQGEVVGLEGQPVKGATVTTSAGGEVQTGPEGSFSLKLSMPADVHSTEVAASYESDSGLLLARILVDVPAVGRLDTGSLQLVSGLGCTPDWLPTYGRYQLTDDPRSLAIFDDGGGPALYAGGVSRLAKLDGTSWSTINGIYSNGVTVRALAAFNDGTGNALYVGGDFVSAGGVTAPHIARWNGATWSAVGTGLSYAVHALVAFDDGAGEELYAAGGQIGASFDVAKWDGSSWLPVGASISSDPTTELAVYDAGSGPVLYAAGEYGVSMWDGAAWRSFGSSQISYWQSDVRALVVADAGDGPKLYIGGDLIVLFNPELPAGDEYSAYNLIRWDGTSFSSVHTPYVVDSIASFDDGTGSALYAGSGSGAFRKWDTSAWSTVHELEDGPSTMLVFDDGNGAALYACPVHGVDSSEADVTGVGRSTGGEFHPVTGGLSDSVLALAEYDNGSGKALYASNFAYPGSNIYKWSDDDWELVNDQDEINGVVYSMVSHDDGSGEALYVGGAFTAVSGVSAASVARWDGAAWTNLGTGMNSSVHAMTTFDDGTGEALYAGGSFTLAGGVAANYIARWDGVAWHPLVGDLDGSVRSLAVADDGTGPELYAGGTFYHAGGAAARGIAKWNGSRWASLGTGLSSIRGVSVQAITQHDDEHGPGIIVGGYFETAGCVTTSYVARWDGSTWSSLGSGMNNSVNALLSFNDGGGPVLYAAGSFTAAGGVSANRIASWNGASWSPLGAGLSDNINVLLTGDACGTPGLVVGGEFGGEFDTVQSGDSFVAKWGGCKLPCSLDADLDGIEDSMDNCPATANFFQQDGDTDGIGDACDPDDDDDGLPDVADNCVAVLNPSQTDYDGDGLGDACDMDDDDDGVSDESDECPNDALRYEAGLCGCNAPDQDLDGIEDCVDLCPTDADADGDGIPNCVDPCPIQGTEWEGLATPSVLTSSVVRILSPELRGPTIALYSNSFSAPLRILQSGDWVSIGSIASIRTALEAKDPLTGEPRLFVGGGFTSANGIPASHVAAWDGVTWSALGEGLPYTVWSLFDFDDGLQRMLVAGGELGRVSVWKNGVWSCHASNLGLGTVLAFGAAFDGQQWTLVAGGNFPGSVAVWSKASGDWEMLPGLASSVRALAYFRGALYAGSGTTGSLGRAVHRWDSSLGVWQPVGSADGYVGSLMVSPDRRSLYASGDMTLGSESALLRWDGTQWYRPQQDVLAVSSGATTMALMPATDDGPVLYVSGSWTRAAGGSQSLARSFYQCPEVQPGRTRHR